MDKFLYQPTAEPIYVPIPGVDAWYRQTSEPARYLPRMPPTGIVAEPIYVPIPGVDAWYRQAIEPARIPPGLVRDGLVVAPVLPVPTSVPGVDAWYQVPSQPIFDVPPLCDYGLWTHSVEPFSVGYDEAPSSITIGGFEYWGPFVVGADKNPIPRGFAYWTTLKNLIRRGLQGLVLEISGGRQLATWESPVLVDASFPVYLKLPASPVAGDANAIIITAGAANVQIVADGEGLVNGAATYLFSGIYERRECTCIDGTNWIIA